mgnify:CR=1 FL=1
MRSEAALALIDKMKNDLAKSGIVTDNLVKDLKELRPYAIEEEDPSLTKVIRLSYEHLEENGSWNIPIPDEVEEEDEELEETPAPVEPSEPVEMDFEMKRESLDYLLSIMTNCDENKINREDLIGYRNSLMEY